MIVSGPEGFIKNAYRKFNIKSDAEDTEFQAGDDYAMMREVLSRRFARAQKEDPDRSGGQWPLSAGSVRVLLLSAGEAA